MPFKSKAQRRKFAELLITGKISPETFEEWNRSTGSVKLPEYAQPKPRRAVPSRSKTAKTIAKKRIPKKRAKTQIRRKSRAPSGSARKKK